MIVMAAQVAVRNLTSVGRCLQLLCAAVERRPKTTVTFRISGGDEPGIPGCLSPATSSLLVFLLGIRSRHRARATDRADHEIAWVSPRRSST